MPMVSVVIPAYNAERYLEDTVRSVLRQTYQDFEIILVDDCSTDGTKNMMDRLAEEDSRITVLQNPQNSGVSVTRNFGVSQAKGAWIAFLDSDDQWTADKLEHQMALIAAHPDAVLTYTGSSFVDQSGAPFGYVMEAEPEITYQMLLRRNLISCSSVVIQKSVMARFPFGSDKMSEDYAAWLQILRVYPCAYGVNKPLLIYRISRNSKSGNRLKAARMHYRAYRYVGYGAVMSGWLTVLYTFYSVAKRRRIART